MASITSPDFPGERLIVCRNPDLAAQRTRKCQELLAATERDLARIVAAVARKRNPLRGAAAIALAVGAPIEKHKMRKHFDIDITDTSFSFARKVDAIAAEAANDGIYIVRTSLPAEVLDDAATVRSYKSLSQVERAFRCIKTVDLHVRPVHHWRADRVRAHVFLCMLAHYLEWHMQRKLAPLLFDDADKDAAEASRKSIVASARRSPAAIRKETTGLTSDGLPVHSFRTGAIPNRVKYAIFCGQNASQAPAGVVEDWRGPGRRPRDGRRPVPRRDMARRGVPLSLKPR